MQAGISKAGSIKPGAVMALLLSLVVLGVLLATAQTPPTPPGNLPLPAPPPGNTPPPTVTVGPPPVPVFSVLDNGHGVVTIADDEAVGSAYLRLTLVDQPNLTYNNITLSVQEAVTTQPQSKSWTQSEGQLMPGAPGLSYDFCFTSTQYHNGNWKASATYQWKRWDMGQLVEQGDGGISDQPFVVNNIVVTDAYDTDTASRHFLVIQGDEVPVIHADITAHQFGNANTWDNITHKVYLRALGAGGGTWGPWGIVKTLAGSTDSVDIPLDQQHRLENWTGPTGTTGPVRGVYAFNVMATAYTGLTSGSWCDGLPEVDPGAVEVTAISPSTGDCTATANATYDIAVTNGSSTKFEFYGPTTSSPDIALRNTITGGTAALGSNEKQAMSLSMGVSDTHYLGVATLDEHTERYRSRTARWALASGWTAPVQSADMWVGPVDWNEFWAQGFMDGRAAAAYEELGNIACPEAPTRWLFRGRWLDTGFWTFTGCNSAPVHDTVQASINTANVFQFLGHGGTDYLWLGHYSDDIYTQETNQSFPNLQLAVFLSCHSADPSGSWAQHVVANTSAASSVGVPGPSRAFVSWAFSNFFWQFLAMERADGSRFTIAEAFTRALRTVRRAYAMLPTDEDNWPLLFGNSGHPLDPGVHFETPRVFH